MIAGRAAAELRQVWGAVTLSVPVVVQDPAQLAGQLVGRLLGSEGRGVARLLRQAQQWQGRPWLRPLAPSLAPGAGPLRQALVIPQHPVNAGESLPKPGYFDGLMAPVYRLAVSTDGTVAVAADLEGHVHAWDLTSGVRLWECDASGRLADAVAISPDAKRASAAFDDRSLTTWDMATGTQVSVTPALGEVVALSHDAGEPCALVARDGQLWLSCAHRQRAIPIGALPAGLGPAALAPRCGRVVAADGSDLWVWDPDAGLVAGPLPGHDDAILCLTVTPDGRRAVTGSKDKTLIVWDIESGKIVSTLIGHSGFVLAVSAGTGASGGRAVSTSMDRSVIVWDLDAGDARGVLDSPVSFARAAISADAATVVTTTPERALRIWDLGRWEESSAGDAATDLANLVAAAPSCDRCVIVSYTDKIRRWDLTPYVRGGMQVGQSGIFGVWALAVTADGRRAVTAGSGRDVEIWDLEEPSLVRRFEVPHERIKSVAVTADGTRVVSIADESLAVSDLGTGQLLSHAKINGVERVLPTVEADRVLALGAHSLSALVLPPGGEPSLEAALEDASTILLSRDGRSALLTDESGRRWFVTFEGERRGVPLAAADGLWSLAVPPGSGRIVGAASSTDSRSTLVVSVWDAETGCRLATASFSGDLRPLKSASVSLDGTRVLVCDNGGRTHFLELCGFG